MIARRVAKAPTSSDLLYQMAATDAASGAESQAMQFLQNAVSNGLIDYRTLALDPRFDVLRQNDGFHAILSDLNARVAEMRAQLRSHLRHPR